MSESLTRQLKITKEAVRGKGVVVAQNGRAAEVGADILRRGGNAIDAAVATGMAIGALEPWMSGIGGVGFMTIWSAKEKRAWTIDYGPISAKKLDPANYRIVGPGPANPFAWPDIFEQRNEVGFSAIASAGPTSYQARIGEPLSFEHHGVSINVAGGLTAGPTLKRTIELAGAATQGKGAPGADFFVAIAQGMHHAYEERLKTMGDKPTNTCTTHFCAADSEGNMVALTQTLMSLFGSCVMLPKTGITMNNGMLWFDPEPNRPNSIAPGKRPLCNICPVVVVKAGKPWFCIGASGGRRIVPAVTQLSLMLIDRGLDVETAFHQPRIDVSGVGPIRVNRDLPDAVKKAIAAKLPVTEVANQISPLGFANPSCIVRDPATEALTGMNEVMSPWAGGAAQ